MSQGRYISGELVSSVYVVNMTSGGGGGGAVDSVVTYERKDFSFS